MQIQDNQLPFYNDEHKLNKAIAVKQCIYPYTGLLTKHVRSIHNRPIFYFEVKFVGLIDEKK